MPIGKAAVTNSPVPSCRRLTIGVPFAVLVGEDEMAEGLLSVKDMRSGQQQKMSPADAARFIRESVAKRNDTALIVE